MRKSLALSDIDEGKRKTQIGEIETLSNYNGKIPRNSFAMYHVDPDHKEREFLTLDELTAMTEIKLEDPNMAFARDLFP